MLSPMEVNRMGKVHTLHSSGKRQSKMKITTLKQIDKQDNFR